MSRLAVNRAMRGSRLAVGVVLGLLLAILLAVVLLVTCTGHSAATARSVPASPAPPISSAPRAEPAVVHGASDVLPCRIHKPETRRAIDFLGARRPTTPADLLAVCKLYGAS